MSVHAALALLMIPILGAGIADAAPPKTKDTIKSLDNREVELRPGRVIVDSSDLARENYREFLNLVSDDPDLRAEAMRRLGDLELEATEAEQMVQNIDALNHTGYNNAVDLYRRLLESYPDYARNDAVLYQLARANEIAGRTDDALKVLQNLVARYPNTPLIDEIQFRRGEMLFLRRRYNDAEMAYQQVVQFGDSSRFYEQSLYKLGWSRFKLAWHEESFAPFFELLDRKLAGIEIGDGERRLQALSRAERELVEDTFRVLSIGFSYMQGARTIDRFLAGAGTRSFAHVVYGNLGDLYLEQERYQDAAETYHAFVAQDPYHAKAPLLQVQVIEAYKQGGFPGLVLQGKEDFVETYGMDGEFWQRHSRQDNAAVAAQLKTNLTDLAQYYHAEAQEKGEAGDYRKAANWYRKYLAYFPGEADSAPTHFLLAEILYESGDFAAAADEYERTAYEYAVHERSAEAAYAAILAYRAHEPSLAGEQRAAWHSRYLDSGLKFADTFPQHPESGAVLTTVAEDLFEQRQFDLAIAVAQNVVAKVPPVQRSQARTAWTVIAHSRFDTEDFSAAEWAYQRLREFQPEEGAVTIAEIDDRIASSIYKQGEQARDAGDLDTAVSHFMRLGQVVPNSEIRATAEYDAAAALINLKAWERASAVLEQFRNDYPDSEFADEVTEKLAVSYLEAGRAERAAGEFERIAMAPEGDLDVQREALWKAADLYRETDSVESERRILDSLVARFPDPLSESIEARFRLLEIARRISTAAEVSMRLEELVAADATAGSQRSDRTRFLAASAVLELADPVRQRFLDARLTQPLAGSLPRKKQLMEDVIRAYTDAADYGVAGITTAATYRLGEVYEQFSSDLMESDRPGDLQADALEQYEILLEEQAFPFEEKAIELYQANTDRVSDGVYDEWVRRSFERLAGLMPARYAKEERSEDVVTTLY